MSWHWILFIYKLQGQHWKVELFFVYFTRWRQMGVSARWCCPCTAWGSKLLWHKTKNTLTHGSCSRWCADDSRSTHNWSCHSRNERLIRSYISFCCSWIRICTCMWTSFAGWSWCFGQQPSGRDPPLHCSPKRALCSCGYHACSLPWVWGELAGCRCLWYAPPTPYCTLFRRPEFCEKINENVLWDWTPMWGPGWQIWEKVFPILPMGAGQWWLSWDSGGSLSTCFLKVLSLHQNGWFVSSWCVNKLVSRGLSWLQAHAPLSSRIHASVSATNVFVSASTEMHLKFYEEQPISSGSCDIICRTATYLQVVICCNFSQATTLTSRKCIIYCYAHGSKLKCWIQVTKI